jgi:selenocysteine-specific elongation factor
MLVSDRVLQSTQMFDARLTLFADTRLAVWSQVILHLGTYEGSAKIHLLEGEGLSGGESSWVQIHLKTPCVMRYGDRFVIRNSSGDLTLGGGEVLDCAPLHHRKRTQKVRDALCALAQGGIAEVVAHEVRKQRQALYIDEIARSVNMTREQVSKILNMKLPADIALLQSESHVAVYAKSREESLRKGILKVLTQFRLDNPLTHRGATFEEIRGGVKVQPQSATECLLREVLARQTEKGKLKEAEKGWLLASDQMSVNTRLASCIQEIERYLVTCGMQTPLMSEMKQIASRHTLSDKELRQILGHLVQSGKVCRVEEEYLHATVVDRCRSQLVEALTLRPEGVTVAQFRDITGGNRKICLLLLAQFDAEKITRRQGDVRVLIARE